LKKKKSQKIEGENYPRGHKRWEETESGINMQESKRGSIVFFCRWVLGNPSRGKASHNQKNIGDGGGFI